MAQGVGWIHPETEIDLRFLSGWMARLWNYRNAPHRTLVVCLYAKHNPECNASADRYLVCYMCGRIELPWQWTIRSLECIPGEHTRSLLLDLENKVKVHFDAGMLLDRKGFQEWVGPLYWLDDAPPL